MLYCKKCGAEVEENFRFCEKCFANLKEEGAVVNNCGIASEIATAAMQKGIFSPDAVVYDYDFSGCSIEGCRLTEKLGSDFESDFYAAVDEHDMEKKYVVRYFRMSEKMFVGRSRIISGQKSNITVEDISCICSEEVEKHRRNCETAGIKCMLVKAVTYISADKKNCHIFIICDNVVPFFLYVQQEHVTIRTVVKFAVQICKQLIEFERNNIVYNSIYESNMYIKQNEVYLDAEIDRTIQQQFIDTPVTQGYSMYVPTEMIGKKSYALYSLAVMMYRMFNGGNLPYMNYYNDRIEYSDFIRAEHLRGSFAELQLPVNAENMLGSMLKGIISADDWYNIRISDVKNTLENALDYLSAEELDRKIY